MWHLQIRIKHPFDVTVQRAHDADPRQHCRAAALSHKDQRLHRGLPLRRIVLRLRQFHDVVGRVAQGDEAAAIWKRYWILKRGGPGQKKDFFQKVVAVP